MLQSRQELQTRARTIGLNDSAIARMAGIDRLTVARFFKGDGVRTSSQDAIAAAIAGRESEILATLSPQPGAALPEPRTQGAGDSEAGDPPARLATSHDRSAAE